MDLVMLLRKCKDFIQEPFKIPMFLMWLNTLSKVIR
jgi:hypothetical protein